MTEYDGTNPRREQNIKLLRPILSDIGNLRVIPALHSDPAENVRTTVRMLGESVVAANARLTIDVSTYTRKHLIQLLWGLDAAGMLRNARLLYSQPADYHTADNEPTTKGVGHIGTIDGFGGPNWPSRDTLLVLFLGYEGRRAQAMWEYLAPNQTVVVVPDPPYKPEWRGRTEEQNRYLLSMIPSNRVLRCSSSDPSETEQLLQRLETSRDWRITEYNYRVAPMGTKAQLIGVYRFWRARQGDLSVVYASPGMYRDRPEFPCSDILLLDDTSMWKPIEEVSKQT
jgi:hypothetical protein